MREREYTEAELHGFKVDRARREIASYTQEAEYHEAMSKPRPLFQEEEYACHRILAGAYRACAKVWADDLARLEASAPDPAAA